MFSISAFFGFVKPSFEQGVFQDFGEFEMRGSLDHGARGRTQERGSEPPFSALSAVSVCSALQNALPANNLKHAL
jgi:hypothetical protein